MMPKRDRDRRAGEEGSRLPFLVWQKRAQQLPLRVGGETDQTCRTKSKLRHIQPV